MKDHLLIINVIIWLFYFYALEYSFFNEIMSLIQLNLPMLTHLLISNYYTEKLPSY